MSALRKIISGGQTGADKTALICAATIGLETGGTAPKGWKVEGGKDASLEGFGLVESPSSDYAPRTKANVGNADVTLWFGKTGSPGYWCTKNATTVQKKPFFINPTDLQLEYICNRYEVVNFAGNRSSKYPAVVELVQGAFQQIARLLGKPAPNF